MFLLGCFPPLHSLERDVQTPATAPRDGLALSVAEHQMHYLNQWHEEEPQTCSLYSTGTSKTPSNLSHDSLILSPLPIFLSAQQQEVNGFVPWETL